MQTQYFFRSDSFPYIDDECINQHLYGENLAKFLIAELSKFDYVIQDYYPEDYGFEIVIQNKAFPLYVQCGNLGNGDNTFGVFISPNQPYIRRWFRKIYTEPVIDKLSQVLYEILKNHQNIYDICFENDFSE